MKKKRRFLNAIIVCLSFLISINSRSQSTSSIRKKISLDEDWKFQFGNSANPEKDFNYGIVPILSKSGGVARAAIDFRFNYNSWRSLIVTHDWAVELPFVQSRDSNLVSQGFKPSGTSYQETRIGWYRKKFKIAITDSDTQFQIQFDRVFRNARFWMNGFFIGNNASGYIGAGYDVTDFINFYGDNILVVRVDATQSEGWFYERAGIYRHVWLNQYDNLHFIEGGQFVHTEVQTKNTIISIETTIENLNLNNSSSNVYSIVTDREGKLLGHTQETSLNLAVNGKVTTKQQIDINF